MWTSLGYYFAYHSPHSDYKYKRHKQVWEQTHLTLSKHTANLLVEAKVCGCTRAWLTSPQNVTVQYALSSLFYRQSWWTWWNVKWASINKMSTAICSAGWVWEAEFDSVVRSLTAGVLASREKTIKSYPLRPHSSEARAPAGLQGWAPIDFEVRSWVVVESEW